jgi:hypothetical protein
MASWQTKDIDVEGTEPYRLAKVVMFPNKKFDALDPKELIGALEGTWKYMDNMLHLYDGDKPLLRLNSCDPDSVTKGDRGIGQKDKPAEAVRWECTEVVSN